MLLPPPAVVMSKSQHDMHQKKKKKNKKHHVCLVLRFYDSTSHTEEAAEEGKTCHGLWPSVTCHQSVEELNPQRLLYNNPPSSAHTQSISNRVAILNRLVIEWILIKIMLEMEWLKYVNEEFMLIVGKIN